jgi:hypothetical protein
MSHNHVPCSSQRVSSSSTKPRQLVQTTVADDDIFSTIIGSIVTLLIKPQTNMISTTGWTRQDRDRTLLKCHITYHSKLPAARARMFILIYGNFFFFWVTIPCVRYRLELVVSYHKKAICCANFKTSDRIGYVSGISLNDQIHQTIIVRYQLLLSQFDCSANE